MSHPRGDEDGGGGRGKITAAENSSFSYIDDGSVPGPSSRTTTNLVPTTTTAAGTSESPVAGPSSRSTIPETTIAVSTEEGLVVLDEEDYEMKSEDDFEILTAVKEFEEEEKTAKTTTSFEDWERKRSAVSITPLTIGLSFQQCDIDYYVSKTPLPGMAPNISDGGDGGVSKISGPVPVLRMYGETENGLSVCCHVHGFLPYFYIAVPEHFVALQCLGLKHNLNRLLKKETICTAMGLEKPVLNVILVNNVRSIMYYNGDQDEMGEGKQKFAKIIFAVPKLVYAVKKLLQTAQVHVQNLGKLAYSTFESNLDFETRFMVDCKIVGCNWIELPAKIYTIRSNEQNTAEPWSMGSSYTSLPPVSRCQIEVDVAFDKMISHSPDEGVWSKVAPFRILSFDIECAGREGIFPQYEEDPVIQIGNMVIRQGETEPFIKTIFTLNTCAPIMEAQVLSYSSEKEMLEAWAEFVRKVDPSIICGYNIKKFDLHYLINRAALLQAKNFHFLGRIRNIRSTSRDVMMQSKQMGSREDKIINMEGRVIFDVFVIIYKDYKLRSYSLNSVSYHFLGEQKEDVHHSIITELQNKNDLTRRRLAIYCLKDALLPIRLLNKLMLVINYMEMARVTGVSLNYLLTRGQQVKVVSQLLRKAKERGYIMPTLEPPSATSTTTTTPKSIFSNDDDDDDDETTTSFQGATVIEPIRGYYDVPIATLDFASLYPSIMMAHNLCYTTLLSKSQVQKQQQQQQEGEGGGMDPSTYIETPSHDFFVKSFVRKGVLPEILEDLLTARKRAKSDLKNEKDPFKRQVLDGRQLALKISANSVYGFTGARMGKLPCIAISQSVTSFGRQMIEETKNQVESQFCTEKWYQHDAKVIYGDTDSVMVKFGVQTVAEAIQLGNEAATFISTKFVSPIKLEFEKVYFPYLLIEKKRYAGLYFTKPHIHDKMDCKGLEIVRRDNCPLVANVMNKCLHFLLVQRDPDCAVAYVKSVISDLFNNKIDLSQLVITKELTKKSMEYKTKQAHVELAKKMMKRDTGTAPKLGERVPYVMIKAVKNTQKYDKAEDPIYVLDHNIPIDADYYLQHQLSKPLERMFEPIIYERTYSELLRGEHTRSKVVITPSVGPLADIVLRQPTCVGCRCVLKDEEQQRSAALCQHCMPNRTEHYLQELSLQSELETKFNRLWSQCQNCQGSLHQEILCTNRDCPIFYMRKKVIKDLESQDKIVSRFDF